jgi:hypothetical protein
MGKFDPFETFMPAPAAGRAAQEAAIRNMPVEQLISVVTRHALADAATADGGPSLPAASLIFPPEAHSEAYALAGCRGLRRAGRDL